MTDLFRNDQTDCNTHADLFATVYEELYTSADKHESTNQTTHYAKHEEYCMLPFQHDELT